MPTEKNDNEKRDTAIQHVLAHHGILGYDRAAKLVDEVTAIVTGARPASAEVGPQSSTPLPASATAQTDR